MQQGGALDAELAEALGVAVESLHETAWSEERAYFLRDVFMEKVFRERGLVTEKDIAKLPAGLTAIEAGKRVRFTPLARDELRRRGIKIERTRS